MRPLQVDPSDLVTLADRCRGWSAELAAEPSPRSGTAASETETAIRSVDAVVRAVSTDLAERMQRMADALEDAANGYRDNDVDSAAALR